MNNNNACTGFTVTFYTAAILVFIITSLFICIFDIRTMHIPLWVLYTGLCLSVIFFALDDLSTFAWRIGGAASLFILFLICRFFSKGKIGLGDLQYSIYCGLVSSFPSCFYSVLISCFICLIFFVIKGLISKGKAIYFTPFMFLGSIFVVFLL
ncbi:MAG: prepilin peptidase [Treponema sp.]|nr:prepilin peptidase [Treponema sp.]